MGSQAETRKSLIMFDSAVNPADQFHRAISPGSYEAVAQSMLYHLQKLGRLLCALLSMRTINLIFACGRSPELGPPLI